MRRTVSILLSIVIMLSLCACGGAQEETPTERDCGIFVTVRANDIYALSYGTDTDSESASNADGTALKSGEVIHFDFAGEAAEGDTPAVIDYTVCIYDKELNVINSESFSNDFSGMARIDITVTADHRILNTADLSSEPECVVVEFETEKPEDSVSVMIPKVIIASYPEAEEAINSDIAGFNEGFSGDRLESARNKYKQSKEELEKGAEAQSFSMKRSVSVTRGDAGVLSLRVLDKTSLADGYETVLSGLNYDVRTGRELRLTDIASDSAKLQTAISEAILVSTTDAELYKDVLFTEGYTDILSGLVSDGHWFFTADGIVIAASSGSIADASYGDFEFTVTYEELSELLKPAFLPAEYSAGSGDVEACFTEDADKDIVIAGSPADDSVSSITVEAIGSITDIALYKISYKSDSKISIVSQLWYCSELGDGMGFVINCELQSEPTLMISFVRPDGQTERRLLSLSSDGSVELGYPDGAEKGTVITDMLPYKADLNSDGIQDTVSTGTGKNGGVTVLVSTSGNESSVETPVVKLGDIRVYDLNNDGQLEIFANGKDADGKSVFCAVSYAAGLRLLPFADEDCVYGTLGSFGKNTVNIKMTVNILGTYKAEIPYTLRDGCFNIMYGKMTLPGEPTVKVTKEIPLDSGNMLRTGSVIGFTETDGSSYIIYAAKNGDTGRINIEKSDSGWTISGKPDTDYFESLPYKN